MRVLGRSAAFSLGLLACGLKAPTTSQGDAATFDGAAPNGDGGTDAPFATYSVLVSGQRGIHGLYSDGREVFFTLEDESSTVRAAAIDGSGVRTLAQYSVGQDKGLSVGDIVGTGDNLAWTNTKGGVFVVDKAGANRSWPEVEGTFDPVVAEGKTVYYFTRTPEVALRQWTASTPAPIVRARGVVEPIALELDATHIFWTERGQAAAATGGVKSIAKAAPVGASPTVLYANGADWNGGGLALTATEVFFAEPSSGRVAKIPKEGGSAVTVIEGLREPVVVRIEGRNLFVLDRATRARDGAVYRVRLDQAVPVAEPIATGLPNPTNMIVDAPNGPGIFVACQGTGEIAVVLKPAP